MIMEQAASNKTNETLADFNQDYGRLFADRKLQEENEELKHRNRDLERKVKRLELSVQLWKLASRLTSRNYVPTQSNIKTLFGDEMETKRIFRKIISKLHPDSGGDEEMFKKVSEVYQKEFK